MICDRCKETIPEGDDVFDHYGKNLCEDCYIGAVQPPRSCDPTAVDSARSTRAMLGQSGTQGLTPIQKRIYELICEKGKISREELFKSFELPQWEMEKQFAILRHCELVRATKEDGIIYVTTL
ncbi:MAG: hypothetical protein JL50_00240 [Peptococcaceae bacterium BICA1-7]|nr:MAG: hypothetical protein JL50_00240 [Peptococcaceae bacterium BICA1-7]HBV98187.1 hypothetical protein [Desulfotomaculum sp.]